MEETIRPGGLKEDLWILRLVAQSKNVVLPVTELIKEAKSKSKYPSILRTLKRLSPETDIIPGRYLFCYDDFIRANAISIEYQREKELKELLRELMSALKESYGDFLQWRWNVEPELESNSLQHKKDGSIFIVIKEDKNNSIMLKLLPWENKSEKKALLTFRKRFKPSDDVTKYTKAEWSFRWFTLVWKDGNRPQSFKIRKQYATLRIPLIPKHKEGKLYFRTLSQESYYSNVYSRRYLDRTQTDNGEVLSLSILGLLAYALDESDYEEFDKSLENLAENDEYQKVSEAVNAYNAAGQTTDFPICFKYRIKKDFPFLAYYNDIKRILPVNFVVEVIRRIATGLKTKKLQDRLTFGREYLKYIVTKQFLEKIEKKIHTNTFDDSHDKVFKAYRTEISTYITHLEQKASIREQNQKILFGVEDRKCLLIESLETVIKNSEDVTNNEVIPIHELIIESRLSWFDISEVLKSIAKTHAKRYIVTDMCLMPRSKAKELKPLLRNGPTFDDACLSLMNNGVPKKCISEELFEKLGFQSTLRKSNFKNTISVIRRKEPAQRSKIHVYHDDSKKVTVISIPKK